MQTPFSRTQLKLVEASERRQTGTDRHGSYAKRDERRVQAQLRPRTGNVSNVVSIRPVPEPPEAA